MPPGLTSTKSNTHDTAYNTHTNDGTPACGMERIIGTGTAHSDAEARARRANSKKKRPEKGDPVGDPRLVVAA